MNNRLENKNTLLIINGKPYSLVKEIEITTPYPCALCDLSDICQTDNQGARLIALCTETGVGGGWFFEENWEVYPKAINVFIDEAEAPSLLDK